MNKLDIAKKAVSFVVCAGTTKIVHQIIVNNSQPKSTADLVSMTAGGFVIGAIVADASRKYTDEKIDEIATWWNENVKPKLNK
jgi:hypothetical protein